MDKAISGRIYVEGHGCSASIADTEMIRGVIEQGGYDLVDEQDSADLSVLVTCSVKGVTEQRMLSRIRDLTQGGSKRVIVAGCLPKADPGKVTKVDPYVSMIGPDNLDKILPVIESTLSGERATMLESKKSVKLGMPRNRLNHVVGIVEISSGCLSSCTFCQVKLVKGNVFSYPEEQIVDEARALISLGAKEIWLTSTDNAAYGRDSRSTLPSLLRKVSGLSGNYKIRLGMMNPLLTKKLVWELVDCFKNEKVFKFVHLPVQSGSERVLKLMQRGYSIDDFIEMVETFRREIPQITLSTDMIVGFPTETTEDFEASLEFLERVRPDVVNISRYGARFGTKAALMKGQIDPQTSKTRSARMTTLVREIQKSINSRWVGWCGMVLVDELVKGAVVGRNFAYKPCLLKNDSLPTARALLGREVLMKITDYTSSTLRGELILENENCNVN